MASPAISASSTMYQFDDYFTGKSHSLTFTKVKILLSMGLLVALDRMSTKLFCLPISSKFPTTVVAGVRGTEQVDELVTKLDKLAVFALDENKLAVVRNSPKATGSSADPMQTM